MIQVAGILKGFSTARAGGVHLRFETNEITPEQVAELTRFVDQFGWILIQPNRFYETDIPKEQANDDSKSPSQRLRSVLFIRHQQIKSEQDFNVYYSQFIETVIQKIKDQLV